MTNTRNILTIIALSALGLCLFLAFASLALKSDKKKKGFIKNMSDEQIPKTKDQFYIY